MNAGKSYYDCILCDLLIYEKYSQTFVQMEHNVIQREEEIFNLFENFLFLLLLK